MNKILVPIENFSSLSLSASYFAIKFAKRNPTKILFLVFSSASLDEAPSSIREEEVRWRKKFDGLIQQARTEKVNLELFVSNNEYLEAVSQFARDHNATEIFIALPQVQDTNYQRQIQVVNALRNQVDNQIIIVKPREEQETDGCQESGSREIRPQRSGTVSGKKGS